MPSQDVTLLLCPVISSLGGLVSASFNHVYHFANKNRWRKKLKSNQKNLRTELTKSGVDLNYILSNR